MATILGIDPGKNGGIARIDQDGARVWKMPATDRDLFDLIKSASGNHATVYIERVYAGPRMGSSAAFKFGRGVGSVAMACVAAGVRVEWVSPQRWQRALGLIVSGRGLGKGDAAKKNRNKGRAQELFPGLAITHATADALLIAEYGARQTIRKEVTT